MLLLALSLSPAAQAFCGTYVGQAGSDLYNSASQIVVARQGVRTTLTLANDYEGDATDFALVVPVPEVLGPEDVSVVDPELFGRLDAYSAPRLVSYTCDDFYYRDYATASDSASAEGSESADPVTIEATFTAGEYDIVILSATESTGLLRWLEDNGYGVGEAAVDLLGEYIEAGSYFFAARVSLDRLPEGRSFLSPLSFGYDSAVFSLPVRLGTLNSPGIQDLILYAVNDYADGSVGVANYPEATLEDECMYRPENYANFGEFYLTQFDAAMGAHARPAWVREYAWGASGCDPCSGTPPSDEDLALVGYTNTNSDAFFTRLHMRYGADGVDQDLVLYASHDPSSSQVRYIVHETELESHFPVCGEGLIEDGGFCDDPYAEDDDTGDAGSPLGELASAAALRRDPPRRARGPPRSPSSWRACLPAGGASKARAMPRVLP